MEGKWSGERHRELESLVQEKKYIRSGGSYIKGDRRQLGMKGEWERRRKKDGQGEETCIKGR